jgi:type II secretory pathway component PulJ
MSFEIALALLSLLAAVAWAWAAAATRGWRREHERTEKFIRS